MPTPAKAPNWTAPVRAWGEGKQVFDKLDKGTGPVPG